MAGAGNGATEPSTCAKAETPFKYWIVGIPYNEIVSDSAYIALNLADVYTSQNRFVDTETVLVNAIRRTPANGDAYYGLAVAYFNEKRFTDAESAALQAESRNHRIADVHLLLAKIYGRSRNTEKTAEQLRTYLNEAPDGPQSEQVRNTLQTLK